MHPQNNPLEQPKLLRRAVEMIVNGNRRHPDEIAADLPFNRATLETLCNLPPGFLSVQPPEPQDLTLK